MKQHAAIIGGSVAGLAAGVALARRGWQATIVERDVAPPTDDGDEAFLLWDRRNVPQFRQPHAFSARSRNLLLEYIPEAVDRMRLDGIDEVNLFKMLAPPELWSDEDDAYAGLWTRRPGFELALRRVAESEPGVTILSPAVVSGLIADHDGDRLVVAGMSLADGATLDADVVLDCGGRRAPTPKWLAPFGVDLPSESQDCGAVYYSRYYRLSEGSPLSLFGILGVREELERANVIGFPGDHNTYGLAVFVPPDDQELKVLRQDWAWDAFFAALPRVGAWADPTNGTPLTSVQFMGEHQNVRWHPVVDGVPLVTASCRWAMHCARRIPCTDGARQWPSPTHSQRSKRSRRTRLTSEPPRSLMTGQSGTKPTRCIASLQRWTGFASTGGTARRSPSGTGPRPSART